jgi:hypothetical protein
MLKKQDYGIVNSSERAISLAQGVALCKKRTPASKPQRGAIHANNEVMRSYVSAIVSATEVVLLLKSGRNEVCLSTNSATSGVSNPGNLKILRILLQTINPKILRILLQTNEVSTNSATSGVSNPVNLKIK